MADMTDNEETYQKGLDIQELYLYHLTTVIHGNMSSEDKFKNIRGLLREALASADRVWEVTG